MQGVHRVRDLAVGHVVVAQKLKKKKERKEKRRRKREKKESIIGPVGAGSGSMSQRSGGDTPGASGDHSDAVRDTIGATNTESETESDDETDSDAELDDEAKKAKEQYLQEIKETKLRAARKILFGDFAVF